MFAGTARRGHRRPRPIVFTLVSIVIVVSSPPIATPSSSSSSSFVGATKVTWRGNEDVSPEHADAHNAPRSQRYWDEHGITRPDYAKTDAEIAAERRRRGRGPDGDDDDDGGGGGIGIVAIARFGLAFLASSFVALAIVARADASGRWDDAMSSRPFLTRVARCARWITGPSTAAGGGRTGNRLGTSSFPTDGAADGTSEEEARRMARLRRFDNATRDMLDDMKEE